MAKHDITGQRFGRLVARRIEPTLLRNTRWRCKCDCGGEAVVVITNLRSGHTRSCGCYGRQRTSETRRTHGESHAGHRRPETKLYRTWCNMRARCNRPGASHYHLYGGRGIRVCAEWDSFEAFRDWALANGYAAELSIDRIDSDGDYSPDNCRWATPAEQVRNSRKARLITHEGHTACIKDHAARLGLSYFSLRYRLNKGMTVAAAVAELKD